MDVSKYIRDPAKVKAAIIDNTKAHALIAKKPVRIYFPKHYLSGRLGSIEANVRVVAIYAIVVEDKYYAVSNITAKIPLTPDRLSVVKIEDSPYYELSWDEGSIISPNTRLVKDPDLAYFVNNEFVDKGNTPWYMSPLDLNAITNSFKKHAGVDLGVSLTQLGIQTAARMRLSTDLSKYAREIFKSRDDLLNGSMELIPLNSVGDGTTNAMSRMLGGYASEGLVSSLVNESDSVESIERHLRS